MQSPVYLFFLLLLLVIKVHGDDKIEYPKFPRQAEFLLENLINDGQHRRILFQCYYDSIANHLIIINEQNYEFHNYTQLKKAIYSSKQCEIYPIDRDNPLDGFSAVTNAADQQTHIRTLQEFFLFTSTANYLGESLLRGFIHVQQWKSSITNDSEIIWSFAKSNYTMPWKSNGYSIPIQRVIRRKDDGLILQVLNVFDYKPRITMDENLKPPKGVFCADWVPNDQLVSLQDLGLSFPEKFSVWIDVSTSSQRFWRSIQLRYYATKDRRLIRYDYAIEENFLDPMTMILDLSETVLRSYQINRRTGACLINQSTEIILTRSVLHDPIETLIKYEDFLLTKPKKQFFQYTGQHRCRGSIVCETYIGQVEQFPSDPETDWAATNIEWAWSKQTQSNYPIYLDLNLYEQKNFLPRNIHYEFYDYHPDVHSNEFDVNLCYRSNQLSYEHLVFQLQIIDSTEEISYFLPRRQLTELIHQRMISLMNIDYLRVSRLELDYQFNEREHNHTIYCIFTLLDRTPFVEIHSQIELNDARAKLDNAINTGVFQFSSQFGLLIDAIPNSLETIEYLDQFNLNGNPSIPERIERIQEKIEYSYQVQMIAVISGIFLGILLAIPIVLIVVSTMKRRVNRPSRNSFAFENISFHVRTNGKEAEQDGTVTMEHPVHASENTSN